MLVSILVGVYIDSDLSFSSHMKVVITSAFYHLSNVVKVRDFMSQVSTGTGHLEKLSHAFSFSSVD